jgi:alkylhydroperoxidase family enzyme
MDIGSAVGRAMGVTERQLEDMARFEASDAFDADEKLVLRFTVGLTKTPVAVDDALFAELKGRFDEAQLVEIAATIAWENFRARFNRGFAVSPQGFSEGAACVLPERPAAREDPA